MVPRVFTSVYRFVIGELTSALPFWNIKVYFQEDRFEKIIMKNLNGIEILTLPWIKTIM